MVALFIFLITIVMGKHMNKVHTTLILVIALILTACGGSGSDSTVAAEFSVKGVKGTVSGQNVTLDLSSLGNCAVDIKALVVSINASGYTISPDPTAARDYSAPVEFTLTAPDGTKAVYKVTVLGTSCGDTTPTPTACTAAPIGSTGYSLVFKGCDAANVATYYDKTECVRDNATGLIWQGQTGPGTGLRANDELKTNFDSTTALQKWNGDIPPTFRAPTQMEIDDITNSIGFKNAVNNTNLCGSSAWRLPTKDELLGIVKTSESPTIDNVWFPNTAGRYYWTSSHDEASGAAYAWHVGFDFGYAAGGLLDNYDGDDPVRLVRN